jgi:hypothetical protein
LPKRIIDQKARAAAAPQSGLVQILSSRERESSLDGVQAQPSELSAQIGWDVQRR